MHCSSNVYCRVLLVTLLPGGAYRPLQLQSCRWQQATQVLSLPPPCCACCPLQVGDYHWLPTLEMLGGSPSKVALNLLAVLPVM